MIKDIKPLAKLLDDYITDRDLTQSYIARELDVSRREVYRWKEGLHEPSALALYKLIKLLKIPINEVIAAMESCTY